MIKAQKYTSLYKGGTLKEHAQFLKEAKLQITGSRLGKANPAISGVKAKTQDSPVGDSAFELTKKSGKAEISGVKGKTVDQFPKRGVRAGQKPRSILGSNAQLSTMGSSPAVKGETFDHAGEAPKFEAVKAKLKARFEARKLEKAKIKEAETKVEDDLDAQDDLDFDPEDLGVGEDLSDLEAPAEDSTATEQPASKLADDLEQFIVDHEAELMEILGKSGEEKAEAEGEDSEDDEEEVETIPEDDEDSSEDKEGDEKKED